MADRKITDLTALAAGSQATGDLVTIVDVSESAAADKNKKMTMENLFKGIPGDVGIGTSSPDSTLELAAGPPRLKLTRNTSASTGNDFGRIVFENSEGTELSRIDSTSTSGNTTPALRFTNNGSERMQIDSSGRLLVGTTSALDTSAEAIVHVSDTLGARLVLGRNDTSVSDGNGLGGIRFAGNDTTSNTFTTLGEIICQADGTHAAGDNPTRLVFSTTPDGSSTVTERVRIDSSGHVGIGVTNPGSFNAKAETLVLANGGDDVGITLDCDTDKEGSIYFADGSSGDNLGRGQIVYNHSGDSLRFVTNASERMRLVGTNVLINQTSSINIGSSADANLQIGHGSGSVTAAFYCTANSAQGGTLILGSSRGSATTAVQDDDTLGDIRFAGSDGTDMRTQGARIRASVDGTPGSDDMPARLAFDTTPDGSNSPTERMRITSSGDIRLAMANFNNSSVDGNSNDDGIVIDKGGGVKLQVARDSGTPMAVNRIGNDGNLINLRQAGNQEGALVVSGSSVTLSGAHLSRWSQLAGGAERTEILRGSVLSNLDEMCEWGEENNEQLNRMKVSDVEGDRNAAGVFQGWDDDDDTYTNDFYCAMTGDFVIRIAQGTTVARGDLLMSAGDGTAKPQDDDIVRSKTIAKVTSTTVSTTYADGSYCVPCVLMAC